MSTIRVHILGEEYTFDASKSQLLKRGLIDPYDRSDRPGEWVVLEEYVFWSHRIQQPIVVPRWFITDLASVPKIFRSFISVNERHRLASLPHDVIYCLEAHDMNKHSRRTVDSIFLDFCKVMGVPKLKRWTMFTAIRLGGWTLFGKKSKEMYIPLSHRIWYNEQLAHMELDVEMVNLFR